MIRQYTGCDLFQIRIALTFIKLQNDSMKLRYILLSLIVAMFLGFSSQSMTIAQEKEGSEVVQFFPLDDIISEDGSSWGIGPDAFMKKYGRLGFVWTSKTDQNTARMYKAPVTFLDLPLCEVLVQFEEGKIREIKMVSYNRGDSGDIVKVDFEKMVSEATDAVAKWMGGRAAVLQFPVQSGGVNKDGRVWTGAKNQVKLEWSYSSGGHKQGYSFRAEYLKIEMQPSGAGNDYLSTIQAKKSMQDGVSRSRLKSLVKNESNGDVYISGIPMVDQGTKGYCVVATTERVMSYYGRDVDQHELAQLAQTQTEGGTSMESMINVLRRLGMGLGCKIIVHQDWDWKSFQRDISDYNRVASKMGKPIINIPKSGTVIVSELYDQFDPSALKESKMKKKADFGKFKLIIAQYVKQGIPLPWTVCLGIVPEQRSVQTRGGHMRMIIGYNLTTNEVIYTDSWGSGHESKRMSMDDAWTITDGLYSIEPRRMTF